MRTLPTLALCALALCACQRRPDPPHMQVTTASGGQATFIAQVRWCEVYRIVDGPRTLYLVVNSGCSVAQSETHSE